MNIFLCHNAIYYKCLLRMVILFQRYYIMGYSNSKGIEIGWIGRSATKNVYKIHTLQKDLPKSTPDKVDVLMTSSKHVNWYTKKKDHQKKVNQIILNWDCGNFKVQFFTSLLCPLLLPDFCFLCWIFVLPS